MNAPRRLAAVRSAQPEAPASPELLFCAVCQVSVSVAEIESGEARWTPRGRLFCAVCATATPDERARRREDLEIEFADDAPVPVARAAAVPIVAPAFTPPPRSDEVAWLTARVGELERAAFRLQTRINALEEQVGSMTRPPA